MSDFAALLDELDTRLLVTRPGYHLLLQPGATEAALDAFEARFSLTLPPMFRRLYRWRNGQDAHSSTPLIDNRTFSPLELVAETKDEFDSMIGSDFPDPSWWRRGWVPFLHNGGGSHLCVDVLAENGGTPGRLVAFWKADNDRPVEFETLEAFVRRVLATLDDTAPG